MSLDKVWIKLYGSSTISNGLCPFLQFEVTQSTIGKVCRNCWILDLKGNLKKIADLSYHFEGEVPNKFSVSEFIFSFGQLLSLLSLVGLGVEVDDAVTIERNINKLKAEITKRKWNTKTVLELLKVTFVEGRKAMLKNDA